MFCRECGKEIDDNSNFCRGCGRSLSAVNHRRPGAISNTKFIWWQRFLGNTSGLSDEEIIKQKKKNQTIGIIGGVTAAVIFVVMIIILVFGSNTKNDISYDSIGDYSASNVFSFSKYDLQVSIFDDKQPFVSYRSLFNIKFGEGKVKHLFYLIEGVYWQDEEGKDIFLFLDGNKTILIHSGTTFEEMGINAMIAILKDLNNAEEDE